MNLGDYEANLRSLAGDRQPLHQITLTQCEAEGRLVPPPAPRREPWPMSKDLPQGVQARRDAASGKIIYLSTDEDTGEVHVGFDLEDLQVKKAAKSNGSSNLNGSRSVSRRPLPSLPILPEASAFTTPVRNVPLSQLSELTETQATVETLVETPAENANTGEGAAAVSPEEESADS